MQSAQAPHSEPLAIIVGNPESLFPRQLAGEFRKRGFTVLMLTRFWGEESLLPCGTRVMGTCNQESPLVRTVLGITGRFLEWLEKIVHHFGRRNYVAALAEKKDETFRPSFVDVVLNALSISSAVRKHKPHFVFGQEAFTYGLATALSRGKWPRVIMPWGGDIYYFAQTSWISFQIVRYALKSADLVCPTSISAALFLKSHYRVSEEKARPISWGVDRDKFRRANGPERERICLKYGIAQGRKIILNVRQFNPAWGSHAVLGAFLKLAAARDDCHFISFGGQGTEANVHLARSQAAQQGVAHRFTFFEDMIPLEICAEIMSVADIFVSLMLTRDMRSFSIIQAASCGAVPVLSEQAEYREMEKIGFRALFVDPEDRGMVADAIERYLSDPDLVIQARNENSLYIERFEDKQKQMDLLLTTILEKRD